MNTNHIDNEEPHMPKNGGIRVRKTFAKGIVATAITIASIPAFPTTYTPSGTIKSLYISQENNYAIRIVLQGNANPCQNGVGTFAYVESTDSNYKAKLAGLLLAKAQGSVVSLIVEPGSSGYCHLIEFQIESP